MSNGWWKQNYKNHKEQSKMSEPVYTLSACEECDKSTSVVYKCWEHDGHSLEVENVVYRCYECAFGDEGKDE